MIDALNIASSGLAANQAWIDSISNNIANMQTVGYKRSQVNFQELVQSTGTADVIDNGVPIPRVGAGIQASGQVRSFTPGDLHQTNDSMDVAIRGDGFFEVTLPSGELAYTRAGRFQVLADGQLALSNGQVLASEIRIPPDAASVEIQPDGVVKARIANSHETLQAGQIRLADFARAEQLLSLGDGLYRPTDLSGEAVYADPGNAGMGLLLQGHVELSNVNLIDEMTGLVLAQRAYQLNARLLQASDQILETINNLRR